MSVTDQKNDSELWQGGNLTCFQCGRNCNYLFDDARCGRCTRLTREEVAGEVLYKDECHCDECEEKPRRGIDL